jgi:hypothetical protein
MYTTYPNTRYVVSFSRIRYCWTGQHAVTDVGIHNTERVSSCERVTEEACYCMVVLLHWQLKYMLDVTILCC